MILSRTKFHKLIGKIYVNFATPKSTKKQTGNSKIRTAEYHGVLTAKTGPQRTGTYQPKHIQQANKSTNEDKQT